jgi:DNA-directed RNA polymerase specialized sigma24 family protein
MMLSLSQTQRVKFADLQSYLERIAHNLVRNYYPNLDPDDLLSEMNLYILERAARDPSFLEQRPGFVSRAAAWAARNSANPKRHAGNYGRDREAYILDAENDDGTDPAEVFAAELTDHDLAIAVREALSSLEGTTRQVAGLLLTGLKGAQAARELGISRQSVQYHKTLVREALAPVYREAYA